MMMMSYYDKQIIRVDVINSKITRRLVNQAALCMFHPHTINHSVHSQCYASDAKTQVHCRMINYTTIVYFVLSSELIGDAFNPLTP